MSTMTIHIDDTKSIRSVQQEFNGLFPFLRLEFFAHPHKNGAGSSRRDMKESATLLKDIRLKTEGLLEIKEDMTVADLEKLFRKHYGLNVQVFRRSGKLWLETTATDNWTLQYQNEQGKELSNGDLNMGREEIDYHEQD